MRRLAVVHYNTPELTEAAILSLLKHSPEEWQIHVFDNSDKRPFVMFGSKKKPADITIYNNTQGKLIDFCSELEKYPYRNPIQACAAGCSFGSAKHMMSVQWLMDNPLKDKDFLLIDSDILFQADPALMFMPEECCCGYIQTWQKANNPARIDRLVPMLLYINTPLCRAGGARFFDPERSFALQGGGMDNRNNWYDSGASFLEDIKTLKPACHGKVLRRDIYVSLFLHYGSGSWRKNDLTAQMAWLERNRHLWIPYDGYKLESADIAPQKPQNAKIFICTHKEFTPKVSNPIYEVVDARTEGDERNGVPGAFFSELLVMERVAKRKDLPDIIGFCGWRKYFEWMSVIPDLDVMLTERGCCVSAPVSLQVSVREHYATVGNVEDLDLATAIIKKKHKTFAKAWQKSIDGNTLHPASMFVMRTKDFMRMIKIVSSIVNAYLKEIGSDIDGRILSDPAKYHLPYSTLAYQRRVGGQLCERIISAWIDWQFPQAEPVEVKIIE